MKKVTQVARQHSLQWIKKAWTWLFAAIPEDSESMGNDCREPEMHLLNHSLTC